ncbi:MAG TPA: MASE4 domain-containing protein, partial [Salinarimonas sp.]|nr:MASE4 domain-containing protein [Salinarimonas sp.]
MDEAMKGEALSAAPAGKSARIAAVLVALASLTLVAAVAPLADTQWAAVPAFVPAYQSAAIVCDLVTAALLLGHYRESRTRSLLVLASGYLLTAALIAAHTLSFPDLFAPEGLFGGTQTTAWLWLAWHCAFPAGVLWHAWLSCQLADRPGVREESAWPVALAVLAPLTLSVVVVWTVLLAHDALPPLLENGRYRRGARLIFSIPLVLSLLALLVLAWRTRLRSALHLWLAVALGAWAVEILLSAVLNSGRYQAGFYIGRLYGLFAACTVLISLLLSVAVVHARLARALARERDSATAALEASEARYRTLTEAAAHLTWAMRPDGSLSFASAHWRGFTGIGAAEIGVSDWQDLLHPEDRTEAQDRIAGALMRQEGFEITARLRRTDGAWRWMLSRAEPVLDRSGRVVEWIGTSLDITERKEAEE